ncbi:MAG: putative toxin-antitoxin system toxin component, PIN family [Caldilineaceae bacterium]|nr:putative toxin-antitoxin system toxin component, PIN family [Caldilineaceae bacterium]
MRVLLDANIYVSYLLASDRQGTIAQVVRVCFEPDIDLLVPPQLIDEVNQSITQKPYLRDRISQAALDELLQVLAKSDLVPESLDDIASFTADPDDDYLVAYGLFYEVDYLVTGDTDLLHLEAVEDMSIVEPRRFLELWEAGWA